MENEALCELVCSPYLGWLQANAQAAWNVTRVPNDLSWQDWHDVLPGGTLVGCGAAGCTSSTVGCASHQVSLPPIAFSPSSEDRFKNNLSKDQRQGSLMPFSRLVRSCFSSHSCLWMLVLLSLAPMHASATQNSKPKFRVVALAEHGGIHQPFVDAAKVWLGKLATASVVSTK